MSIRFEAVTIRYGDVVAVRDATAEFPRGAVGLLGRNGAGKSSILKALLGLVRPASGELLMFDLDPRASGDEIRRRVGYMSEKDSYVQGLNGYETVLLAGELSGVPRADAARRAHEVLYLVGLEEQRYRPVSGYSAGMRQKVKLAAAMVHDPDVLFLDEPTNGLDPKGRTEMLALIRRLSRELSKSVVLSSHILQDVEAVCAEVVLMDRGRVLAAGPLAELTHAPVETYELDVAGCSGQLVAELSRRGVAVESGEPEAAPGRLSLSVPGEKGTAAVFAAVRGCGGAVLRLVRRRRSLEDVFLHTVRAAEAGEDA